MPIPSVITDLSPLEASNFPAGTDSPITADNTLRVHASFIRQLLDAQISNVYLAYTTGGTSTAYTIAPVPAITAYAAGQSFWVTFNAACGAAPTLQISGVATPPNLVKQKADGTYANLAAGDFPINHRSRVTLLSASQALVEVPAGVQAWSNLTGSRSLSSTYTNSTGRPITVMVSATSGSTGSLTMVPTVAGVALPPTIAHSEALGYVVSMTIVVPDGATYSVGAGGSATPVTLSSWCELR